MNSRILLLPGYGEDARAFRQLEPYISDFELVYIDYRPALARLPFTRIQSKYMAQQLIRHYKISPVDKLLGHSMGGFFSFRIREILGNDICMLGSFSDPAKIIHMGPVPHFTPLLAMSGLSKTPFARKYLHKRVEGKPHEHVMMEVVDNFKTFSNQELGKMSIMTLEKKIPSLLPNPLRIHAIDDRVVRPPDEAYIPVPGGHFSLNTHPEQVFNAMQPFLN